MPADHGTKTRKQLVDVEGFQHVVIGTQVKCFNAILDSIQLAADMMAGDPGFAFIRVDEAAQ